MRIYVLVISADPLKIYMHEEGLVRFATKPYQPVNLRSDSENMRNMFVHLTNYALNKENRDYRQAESISDNTGHKRSITSLMKHLEADNKDVETL